MKRFWNHAEIAPGPENDYLILLDGKPMHLPGGVPLRVRGAALARAIAAEWDAAGGAQGGEMSFADTPLTRFAGTAQERIAPSPDGMIEALARYAETDLLCYHAASPPALVERQARLWQPWIDWAALAYDAPLRVGKGVIRVAQDTQSLRALRRALAAYDPAMLAGLSVAVPALGSLVLGLALAEGRIDPDEAHALAALEELFQAELWGRDPEAERRRQAIADDIASAARFMELARRCPPNG